MFVYLCVYVRTRILILLYILYISVYRCEFQFHVVISQWFDTYYLRVYACLCVYRNVFSEGANTTQHFKRTIKHILQRTCARIDMQSNIGVEGDVLIFVLAQPKDEHCLVGETLAYASHCQQVCVLHCVALCCVVLQCVPGETLACASQMRPVLCVAMFCNVL